MATLLEQQRHFPHVELVVPVRVESSGVLWVLGQEQGRTRLQTAVGEEGVQESLVGAQGVQ